MKTNINKCVSDKLDNQLGTKRFLKFKLIEKMEIVAEKRNQSNASN